MKTRPILFSAPMVRAILEGRKTQTRRVVKYTYDDTTHFTASYDSRWEWEQVFGDGSSLLTACPYGKPGDRLWVKETMSAPMGSLVYRADCNDSELLDTIGAGKKYHWTPSIFMKRRFSRITLEIVAVRVERLQDITNEDAKAEGIEREFANGEDLGWKNYLWHGHFGKYGLGDKNTDEWVHQYSTYADGKEVGSYSSLWQLINGPGSWDANPWVWVIEFRRVQP